MNQHQPGTQVPTTQRRPARPPRRLSEVLRALAEEAQAPVSIGHIRDAMGDRSFAALLVLFAAVNLLPMPPGATMITSLPLMLVAVQMILGYEMPWLPRSLLRRSIEPQRFRDAMGRLIPRLERMEAFVRPRYWPLSRSGADRVIGLVALVLAFAVFVPIPFGSLLPALATILIGLAMSERDGVVFCIGVAVGALALAVIGAMGMAAGAVAGMLFGIEL